MLCYTRCLTHNKNWHVMEDLCQIVAREDRNVKCFLMLQYANPVVSAAANTEESDVAIIAMKICKQQVEGFVWSSHRKVKHFS